MGGTSTTVATRALGASLVDQKLKHYGVPGMKWGQRKRDSGSSSSSSTDVSNDHVKAVLARHKPASALSNQEMQELITRMNLEQQYAKLTTSAPAPKVVTKKAKVGKFVADLLLDIGKQEVTRVAKGTVSLKVEDQLKKKGKTELAKRIAPKKK